MPFLVWGTRPKAIDLGPAGTDGCPACGVQRPFRWRLTYRLNHAYYVFGFVTRKEYLRLCEVCGRGEPYPAASLEPSLGKSPIPWMERYGCLAALGGVAGLILLAAGLQLAGPRPRNVPRLVEAVGRGDAAALARLRSEAEAGDVPSEEALVDLYRTGAGVPRDPAEAFRWATKAAEGGSAGAQHALGAMYELGSGTGVDYAKAMTWYRKADAAHVAAAANSIGTLVLRGLGVPADAAEAVRWFRKAADAGDAAGGFNLAMRYLDGQGVDPDPAEARRRLEKVAAIGGQDPETRTVVALARFQLGRLHEEGIGGEKDPVRALHLYEEASPANEDARLALARLKERLSR